MPGEADGKGAATALFAATAAKAELGRGESSSDALAHNDFKWRNLGIRFNNPEINQRLTDAPQGPMDANARAKLMNQVIRRAFASDVMRHELSYGKLAGEGFLAGMDASLLYIFNLPMPRSLAVVAAARALANPIVMGMLVEDYRKDGPYKYSFAHVFCIDRAAVAASQLIRPTIRSRD